jgi:prepilin-type N-terminal cleavage/methylation domain-containing protein
MEIVLTRCSSSRAERGFTLTELLIVVVILGILAALAIVGFRRYVARARTTEAVAMLSEMASKQQVYFLEFGGYLPLRADNNTTLPSPNEATNAFYPANPSGSDFESARTATSIANPAGWPAAWRSVGLRPRDNALYCTYLLNAGGAGQAVPDGNTIGKQLLPGIGAGAPPWFYAVAACNLTGAAGYPDKVTVLGLTSNSPALRTLNDGR